MNQLALKMKHNLVCLFFFFFFKHHHGSSQCMAHSKQLDIICWIQLSFILIYVCLGFNWTHVFFSGKMGPNPEWSWCQSLVDIVKDRAAALFPILGTRKGASWLPICYWHPFSKHYSCCFTGYSLSVVGCVVTTGNCIHSYQCGAVAHHFLLSSSPRTS